MNKYKIGQTVFYMDVITAIIKHSDEIYYCFGEVGWDSDDAKPAYGQAQDCVYKSKDALLKSL